MAAHVKLNNSGMSIVEVMVANLILLVVFFALMETATLAIRATTEAALQDIASDIGGSELNEARNIKFSDLVSTPYKTIARQHRNGNFNFTVLREVTNVAADYKLVTIKVYWIWKNVKHVHTVNTYVKST